MREISFLEAIGRVFIGIVILIGSLVVFDLIVYISVMHSNVGRSIVAAYEDGYGEGYLETYDSGYQVAYEESYPSGYEKGLEVGLEIGSGEESATLVKVHNPTYVEVREFLERDTTDLNTYIRGVYMCADFAADLNNSAERQGIRAAYVVIRARAWSHAIVAFDTVDRGIVFVEPISDSHVDVEVGEPYRWLTGGTGSVSYEDTVVEIEFIW
jgi:hypothetical protein